MWCVYCPNTKASWIGPDHSQPLWVEKAHLSASTSALCLFESWGWSSWYYVDSSVERFHSSEGHTFSGRLVRRGPRLIPAPSLPLSLWKGNSTPVLKRTPSGYKKGCWTLFRSSPTSGNHSRSSFTRRSSSRIQTHAIFNTFSPHFRTHLPHCLIHRSRSISNKTMDLMQEALYKILWHLWIFLYLFNRFTWNQNCLHLKELRL